MRKERISLTGGLNDYRQDIQATANPTSPGTGQPFFDGAHGLHYINLSPSIERNQITGASKSVVRKRPGIATVSSDSTIDRLKGRIIYWSGKSGASGAVTRYWIYSSYDTSNRYIKYLDQDGNTTTIGTVPNADIGGSVFGFLSETDISGTKTILASTTSGLHAYYGTAAPALTKITDADYPANAGETTTGKFVPLDGYVFIMTKTGKIYNSDLNSVSAWTASNFITANDYPDIGVGLVRYGNTIAAFGQNSIEFFRNAGNPSGSPLQRIQEYSVNGIGANILNIAAGTSGSHSLLEFEDTVYWISVDSNGKNAVYKLVNFKPVKISTFPVERMYPGHSSGAISNIFGTMFPMNVWGHPHLCIPLDSGSKPGCAMLMYNLDLNVWWEWVTVSTANVLYDGANGMFYSAIPDGTGGKIVRLRDVPYFGVSGSAASAESQTDIGVAFTTRIVTSGLDFGSNHRKFMSKLTVLGDSMLGTDASGDPANPTITVKFNDSDYATSAWSSGTNATLNSPMHRLGSFRRRAFSIEESSNDHLRLEALEVEFSEGGS